MPDNPRIDELRRRVQKDPASIAFAQLAEEHRRAGEFDEAIRVCRAGLAQHPGYLSARVTLGRALVASGQYDEAQAELEQVLRAAPDNLAAIRALADIHQHIDDAGAAGGSGLAGEPAAGTPPSLPDLDLALNDPDHQFAQALETLDAMPRILPPPLPEPPPIEQPPPIAEQSLVEESPRIEEPAPIEESPPDPVLAALEGWLAAIQHDRAAGGRSN